jgi:hypothetical protein
MNPLAKARGLPLARHDTAAAGGGMPAARHGRAPAAGAPAGVNAAQDTWATLAAHHAGRFGGEDAMRTVALPFGRSAFARRP